MQKRLLWEFCEVTWFHLKMIQSMSRKSEIFRKHLSNLENIVIEYHA